MALSAALALALLALLVGAAIGHLTARRHRRAAAAAEAEARIAGSEATLAKLRHDIRGALSPALLSADRLTMNADPATARSAEIIVTAVERVSALLDSTRNQNPAAIAPRASPDLNSGSD